MEISLKINGSEIRLSPEQNAEIARMLKDEIKPFERAKYGETYYYCGSNLKITETIEGNCDTDQQRHEKANYCKDRELMETQAALMNLYMQLWRYSMEHGGNEIDWRDGNHKYYIMIDSTSGVAGIGTDCVCRTLNCVYFKDVETAKNACREVYVPWQMKYGDVARALWGKTKE